MEQLSKPGNVTRAEQSGEFNDANQMEQSGEPSGPILVGVFSGSKGSSPGEGGTPSKHNRRVTLIRLIMLSTVIIMGLIPFVAVLLAVFYSVLNPGPIGVDATQLHILSEWCLVTLHKLAKEIVKPIIAFATIYFGLMGWFWGFLQQRLPGRGEYSRSAIYLICLWGVQWLFKTVAAGLLEGSVFSGLKGIFSSSNLKSIATIINLWTFCKLMFIIFLIKKVRSRNFLLAYLPLCLAFITLGELYLARTSINMTVPDEPQYAAVRKMASDHGLDPKRLFNGSPKKSFEEEDGGEGQNSAVNASYYGLLWVEFITFYGKFSELPEDVQLGIVAHELGHRKFHDCLQNVAVKLIRNWVYWLAALRLVLPHESVFAAFGFPVEPTVGAIAIAQFSFSVLRPMRQLISNAFSQYMEYRADAYAVSIGHGAGLAKFFTQHTHDVDDVHPFYSLLNSTHPTPRRRVSCIKRLMNKS